MLKRILVLIFISTILFGCQKEEQSFYKTAEFQQGLPEILNPIEKNLPFKIQSHSVLESNNDSIDIYIGVLKHD